MTSERWTVKRAARRLRDWWRAPRERRARAERELKLQRSVNVALNARLKRMERERDLVYGDVPGLSPAEIERLGMLAGACGELAKAISKTLRFGWERVSPYGGPTNRVALEREMGAVRAIVNLMIDSDDVHLDQVQSWQRAKRAGLGAWTLYQEFSMPREEQLAMMQAIEDTRAGREQ